MTNELEKQFFQCFGIEPEIFTGCKLEKNNWKEDTCPFDKDGIMELCHKVCKYAFTEREIYPQITDRILLELEAIIHNEYNILVYEKFMDSIKITAYPMDDNLPCDPAYFTVMAQADNKREALLVLAMDINVQHYIKQQVQALFEEG